MNITPAAISALLKGDQENFIAASTKGGIEAQEHRGQIAQSFEQTLPIKGTSSSIGRKNFETLGFMFGKNVDGLFVNATFPKGWHKKPTEHSMWSEIIDDKGRKRGMIFYKAAFYDMSAHVHLEPRYGLSCYGDNHAVEITDCGKSCHVIGTYAEKDYAALDALKVLGVTWLKENKPDYDNVMAYWD